MYTQMYHIWGSNKKSKPTEKQIVQHEGLFLHNSEMPNQYEF